METPEIIILKVTVEHLILNIFMRKPLIVKHNNDLCQWIPQKKIF